MTISVPKQDDTTKEAKKNAVLIDFLFYFIFKFETDWLLAF